MDKDVLERQLEALCQRTLAEARAAVSAAPETEGQWIAASEWPVREIFQKPTRDRFSAMIQARADGHATADQAAFSPDAGPGAAQQGPTPSSHPQRRRRN